jgi:CrcB protein
MDSGTHQLVNVGLPDMLKILLIGLGGFIGAILRYGISGLVQNLSRSISFPYGTLAVNVIGCLIVGALSQLVEARAVLSVQSRLFIFVGVLGALTTFSTFSNETINLIREEQWLYALANIFGHIILCFAAVLLGRWLTYMIWR